MNIPRQTVLTHTNTNLPLPQDDGTINTNAYQDNHAARAVQPKTDKEGATKLIKLLKESGTNWIASSPGFPSPPSIKFMST